VQARLTLVADPLPAAWSALSRAAADGAWAAVTADLRVDLGHDDPHAHALALVEGQGRFAGPQSGGLVIGTGSLALVSRLGAGFAAATHELPWAEAIDLGLGWDLDEADLLERWSTRTDLSCIALVAPRPSARLASALRAIEGRVPVIIVDPRDWSALGAATVTSLAALRLALTVPAAERFVLLGRDRPLLEVLHAAMTREGLALVAPPDPEALAQQVHVRATIGPLVDLLGSATARHGKLVTASLDGVLPIAVGLDVGAPHDLSGVDPWALASALRARRDAQRATTCEALATPPIDTERAQAMLLGALVMRREVLTRDEALAFVCAAGFGRPVMTMQIASAAAAQRMPRPLFMGAPDGPTVGPVDHLEDAWEQIDRGLAAAGADRYAARWVASCPAGAPFHVTIVMGDVAPVVRWSVADESGRATLPARADERGPAALLGPASGLVQAFTDLARVEVRGVLGPTGPVLIDAHVRMGADGA